MTVEDLIKSKAELTHSKTPPEPIVFSTRIRLARNLEGHYFPDWADALGSQEVLDICKNASLELPELKNGFIFDLADLSNIEKQVLVERHLASPEFAVKGTGSGVLINGDQSISIMINEEDHFRIQVLRNGFNFSPVWKTIDNIDNELDERLNYAFSPNLGYLTACPTNLGTGMRASMMMHLPGLVIVGQMEKVIRACNQLNLAVRGIHGEGSEATGSIFQISNQQTLGESELEIIRKLTGVLHTVIEQEKNARRMLLQKDQVRVFDKIGRAFGILLNGHCINSNEAYNLLSLMRLGVDLNILPKEARRMIDILLIITQPAHIQLLMGEEASEEDRDNYRAIMFREKFKEIDGLSFDNVRV